MLCLEKYARETLFRNAYASIMLLRRDHRHQIHRSVNVERERESTLEQCFGSVGDHDACSARLARCYTAAKLCIWRVAIRRNHQSRRCSVTSLCNHSLFRQRLVFHACEFQHISPFSCPRQSMYICGEHHEQQRTRCALVAVLQVLPEVISLKSNQYIQFDRSIARCLPGRISSLGCIRQICARG